MEEIRYKDDYVMTREEAIEWLEETKKEIEEEKQKQKNKD